MNLNQKSRLGLHQRVSNGQWTGQTNNFQINVVPTGTLDEYKSITAKSIAPCALSMPGSGRFGLKKYAGKLDRGDILSCMRVKLNFERICKFNSSQKMPQKLETFFHESN
jgi:hypothetical protein